MKFGSEIQDDSVCFCACLLLTEVSRKHTITVFRFVKFIKHVYLVTSSTSADFCQFPAKSHMSWLMARSCPATSHGHHGVGLGEARLTGPETV